MKMNRPEEPVTPWHAVIPRNAWIIAIAVGIGILGLLQLANWRETGPGISIRSLVTTLVPLIVGAAILLYGYIYGDAKRRGMRAVMWVLLAIFIPNLIGVILYFVLRDPMPANCPGCGTPVRHGLAFCPKCGNAMGAVCAHCSKPIETGWSNCAHCGSKIRE